MPVAETSKQAYKKVNHKLGRMQSKVYKALKELGRATDLQLADFLDLPINEVTGRRNELVDYGMVVESGRLFNKTGHTAKAWVITDPVDNVITRIFGKMFASKEVVDCD